MVQQLGELPGSILLCILALLLVAVLFLLKDMNAGRREQLERCFRAKSSQMGYIQQEDDTVEYERYIELLRSVDGVAIVAQYDASSYWSVDFAAFLAEPQQDHKPRGEFNMPSINLGVQTFEVNTDGYLMLDLELYQGEDLESFQAQYDPEEYTPVYLGYEYRSIVEPGTILGTNSSGTYIVAGILEPGMLMPKDLNSLDVTDAAFSYSTDYGVLLVEEGVSTVETIFIEEGYSFPEVQDAIQAAEKAEGISVRIVSLEALLDSYDLMLKPVNRYMQQMVLVVGLTVCILFTCYQTVSIIARRSDYGILYANGAMTRDLVSIILIENLIKLLIALIIMIPVFLLLVQKVYALWAADQAMIQWLFWQKIIWKVLAAGLGMALLSSVFPIYTLTHYTPVTLIGGNQS